MASRSVVLESVTLSSVIQKSVVQGNVSPCSVASRTVIQASVASSSVTQASVASSSVAWISVVHGQEADAGEVETGLWLQLALTANISRATAPVKEVRCSDRKAVYLSAKNKWHMSASMYTILLIKGSSL